MTEVENGRMSRRQLVKFAGVRATFVAAGAGMASADTVEESCRRRSGPPAITGAG